MHKSSVALLLAIACSPVLTLAADAPAAPEWIEQSRQLAQQLGGELKGELGRAINEGGPVAAVSVCKTRAPAIAARLSAESGAVVGRTALRVRNPANAPDDLQRAVLEQFSGELASGKFAGPARGSVRDQPRRAGRASLHARDPDRRPVPHLPRPALAPELAAAIERDYPDDQATGFEQGQLRGAFSVTWPSVPASPANP